MKEKFLMVRTQSEIETLNKFLEQGCTVKSITPQFMTGQSHYLGAFAVVIRMPKDIQK